MSKCILSTYNNIRKKVLVDASGANLISCVFNVVLNAGRQEKSKHHPTQPKDISRPFPFCLSIYPDHFVRTYWISLIAKTL